jgi:hypothetical protein
MIDKMNPLLDWMESTWLNQLALGYTWTWPVCEILHFVGMSLLIGGLLVADLRIMGFERVIPLKVVHKVLPLALIGFGINLTTGIVFIFGDPHRYAINISFQLKMLFVLLAGLNALIYQFGIEPWIHRRPAELGMPVVARVAGGLSLVFWFAVLSFGRLIPYLGTG